MMSDVLIILMFLHFRLKMTKMKKKRRKMWKTEKLDMYGRGKRNVLQENRTRTDMTADEQRLQHQKELANRINEDARERLQGQKSNTEEKK